VRHTQREREREREREKKERKRQRGESEPSLRQNTKTLPDNRQIVREHEIVC
jgi:hypothetical protein